MSNRFYFNIFYIFFCALLPISFIYVGNAFPELNYFMLDLFSDSVIVPGLIYASLTCIILIICVNYFSQPSGGIKTYKRFEITYLKYRNIIFFLALIGTLGNIALNFIYGQAATNIEASRPLVATLLGYIFNALAIFFYVQLLSQFYLYGKFTAYGLILLILFLIEGSLAGSRSGMFLVISLILFISIFSPRKLKINFIYLSILILLGIFFVLFGELIRGTDLTYFLVNALARFFQFNVVLFLALEDFDTVNRILLENQPQTIISQLFSFVYGERLPPSSVRLPEFWGSDIIIREGGHMVGYVYGWMGLSFGLFSWGGLLFTLIFFLISFFFTKKCIENPSIFSFILLSIIALTFFEYFGNLGLDSFLEKIFKRSIWGLITYIIVLFTLPFIKPIGSRNQSAL